MTSRNSTKLLGFQLQALAATSNLCSASSSSLNLRPCSLSNYPGRFDGACSLVYLHRRRPCVTVRSAPATVFSGPAQRSLMLWPARSPSRLATLYIESSDSFVASAAVSIATGWSEPVPGRELHPVKSSAFRGALLRQLHLWYLSGKTRWVLTQKPFWQTRPEPAPHPNSSVQGRGHSPTAFAGADVYSVREPTAQRISTGRPSQPQRPPGSIHEGVLLGTMHFPLLSQPDVKPQR
jgi:hypothetical protein